MIKSLLKDLTIALPAIPILLKAWIRFYKELLGRFAEFWSNKNGKEKSLFLVSFFQLGFSLTSWISYQIYLGMEETESIRVASNIFFILPSAFVFFFGGFWRSEWLFKALRISQGFLGLLLVLGALLPDFFFVSFLREEDYTFNWKFYTFCGTWFLTTIVVLVGGE
ncbi:hypothetical protein CH373_17070 [Leptospira perolatii]|uniref:Uncharacterized protein n=1 Tax=Leptospira perolatii TaxID=2023191 RepID=A0A2M9ZJ13_9LEPT|nr:hypothetical protein [Leptospira perolatii]PJZ68165.1 hypothetical protein CH360_17640 [Leptospira perolatii]PJZ71943.1 hypothetical protein CH373_17070 [Leptospira perolatii]